MRLRIFSVITAVFLLSTNCHAQGSLSQALELGKNGKYSEAIQVYTEILNNEPGNQLARLGRASVYSWNHDFDEANADFRIVLEKDQGNVDAQKGMAYVELWRGYYKSAITSFNKLITSHPGTKEFYIARGQAQLNEGLLKDARESFEKAKSLDPSDNEPADLISAIKTQPTVMDIDILAGISNTGDETKAGLRFFQLSSQVSRNLQLAAKYDNTLSLDNLGLITRNTSAPYYAGSIFYKWGPKTATRFEAGYRDLPDGIINSPSSETQFSLEQVVFFKKGKSIKLGGAIISPSVGENAFLLIAGYHQPVGKKVTAGLNYFYSDRNVFDTKENRFLLDADIRLRKAHVLNAGFYFGNVTSNVKSLEGHIYGGFIKGYLPVSNSIALLTGISLENNFIQNLFNINAGVRFRFEK